MIPARKSEWFARAFGWYAERRITGAFEAVRVRGLGGLRDEMARRPVLVVTNHTAWWDPLVALVVSTRALRFDAYAMMDGKNLERLPFFGKLGAFGVDLGDPADGARAIRYACKLLDRPGRLVWIFAQGREVPITVRPLGFRQGSGEIARLARGGAAIPGALRYEMGSTPRPTLWLSFGRPVDPLRDREAARRTHEAAVTEQLDAIDAAITSGEDSEFVPLYAPRSGGAFAVAQAALARLTRPRALR